jgi:hypothetical protein
MKKQLLILTIASALMLTTFYTHAQVRTTTRPPAERAMVTGGIKGGVNFSNLYIDVDNIDATAARWGFNIGLFTQFMLAETFGFQPELLFTTKGTSATYTGVFDQTVDFNLNYIEVPLLLVVRPVDVLEFHAGPYVSYLLTGNIGLAGTIDGRNELDRDNFNAFDYGIAAGVQLNFRSVMLGLRYNLGLQNVGSSETANLLLGDVRHSYGQVYLAFGIPRRVR